LALFAIRNLTTGLVCGFRCASAGSSATAIADYGVRARPGMPVALPLEWKELRTLKSGNQFSMKDVLKRVRDKTPKSPSRPLGQILPTS
jgi:bifunctional non-homologous end joining protein LigD